MKKIFKNIALFFATAAVMSSCSKSFLELDPNTSIPEEDVFGKYETAFSALVGSYDAMGSYYGEGLYIPLLGDINGEDVLVNSEGNYGWFVAPYQMNVLPTYQWTSNPWNSTYYTIRTANEIIEGTERIEDATEYQLKELKGQAMVMRALGHLEMVRMYSKAYSQAPESPGVLLVDQVYDYDAEDIGRSTVKEVYDFIVEDLEWAADTLDLATSYGFFSKQAAHAILARAYMDMEEWEKARDHAIEAREGTELMQAEQWLQGFGFPNQETIFSIAYTSEDNNIFLSLPSFYWPVAGYSSMRANDDFYYNFSDTDVRTNTFAYDETIDDDHLLITKFSHAGGAVGYAQRIMIRASEMYLIEAECEAMLGNDSKARMALYTIQKRADEDVERTEATGSALVDEILLERRKELYGEGFRWNDIKRRNLPLNRTGDHWVKTSYDPNGADYYKLTYPIPQSEIDRNEALDQSQQNEGY